MKTLIVYDSLYGNTKIIAEAMAEAIRGEVKVVHVSDVDCSSLDRYDLLVVGAPTHGGRASEAAIGLLGSMEAAALTGVKVAAFDTRLTWGFLRLFGYAAPKLARTLESKGGTLVGKAEGFFVTGGEGPMKEGEVERAAAWAQAIAAQVERVAVVI